MHAAARAVWAGRGGQGQGGGCMAKGRQVVPMRARAAEHALYAHGESIVTLKLGQNLLTTDFHFQILIS